MARLASIMASKLLIGIVLVQAAFATLPPGSLVGPGNELGKAWYKVPMVPSNGIINSATLFNACNGAGLVAVCDQLFSSIPTLTLNGQTQPACALPNVTIPSGSLAWISTAASLSRLGASLALRMFVADSYVYNNPQGWSHEPAAEVMFAGLSGTRTTLPYMSSSPEPMALCIGPLNESAMAWPDPVQELNCATIGCPPLVSRAWRSMNTPVRTRPHLILETKTSTGLCGAYAGEMNSITVGECVYGRSGWMPSVAGKCSTVSCATYPCTYNATALTNDIVGMLDWSGQCRYLCASGCEPVTASASGFFTVRYLCGDGVHYPSLEECDDGNNEPGDGCSTFCEKEEVITGCVRYAKIGKVSECSECASAYVLTSPKTCSIKNISFCADELPTMCTRCEAGYKLVLGNRSCVRENVVVGPVGLNNSWYKVPVQVTSGNVVTQAAVYNACTDAGFIPVCDLLTSPIPNTPNGKPACAKPNVTGAVMFADALAQATLGASLELRLFLRDGFMMYINNNSPFNPNGLVAFSGGLQNIWSGAAAISNSQPPMAICLGPPNDYTPEREPLKPLNCSALGCPAKVTKAWLAVNPPYHTGSHYVLETNVTDFCGAWASELKAPMHFADCLYGRSPWMPNVAGRCNTVKCDVVPCVYNNTALTADISGAIESSFGGCYYVCNSSCTMQYSAQGTNKFRYLCGDGNRFPSLEECDDGNNIDGDGCTQFCEREDVIANCTQYEVYGKDSRCAVCADGTMLLDPKECGIPQDIDHCVDYSARGRNSTCEGCADDYYVDNNGSICRPPQEIAGCQTYASRGRVSTCSACRPRFQLSNDQTACTPKDGTVFVDDQGNLHVDASGDKTVFVNGVDVLSLLQTYAQRIEALENKP